MMIRSETRLAEKKVVINTNLDSSTSDGNSYEKYDQINLYFIAKLTSISSIGGFLFGYDTGIVSGAILYFEDTWPGITSSQTELIVSIAMLGAFAACLFAGPICDKYGRKPVIIAADILFTVGSLLMAVAPSIGVLIVGRLLIGFGIGMSSIVIPIYLSEISPDEIRGTVVGMNAAFCPIG